MLHVIYAAYTFEICDPITRSSNFPSVPLGHLYHTCECYSVCCQANFDLMLSLFPLIINYCSKSYVYYYITRYHTVVVLKKSDVILVPTH